MGPRQRGKCQSVKSCNPADDAPIFEELLVSRTLPRITGLFPRLHVTAAFHLWGWQAPTTPPNRAIFITQPRMDSQFGLAVPAIIRLDTTVR